MKKPLATDKAGEVKDDKKSVVPQSKLAAADLWVAYAAKEGQFVVTDPLGNEYHRSTSKKLAATIDKLAETIKKAAKKIDDLAKKAEDSWAKDNAKDAVKNLLQVFKEDKVGYPGVNKAIELYQKVIESGRTKLEAAAGKPDVLKALSDTYLGTDLEGEIKAAIGAAAPAGVPAPAEKK